MFLAVTMNTWLASNIVCHLPHTTTRDIKEGHPISIAEVQLFGYVCLEGYTYHGTVRTQTDPPTIRYAEELMLRTGGLVRSFLERGVYRAIDGEIYRKFALHVNDGIDEVIPSISACTQFVQGMAIIYAANDDPVK